MTTKQATFQELLNRAEKLRDDVFTAREPGDDEMRRVQGLLSEVRDLMQEAVKKAGPAPEAPVLANAKRVIAALRHTGDSTVNQLIEKTGLNGVPVREALDLCEQLSVARRIGQFWRATEIKL